MAYLKHTHLNQDTELIQNKIQNSLAYYRL